MTGALAVSGADEGESISGEATLRFLSNMDRQLVRPDVFVTTRAPAATTYFLYSLFRYGFRLAGPAQERLLSQLSPQRPAGKWVS